MSAAARTALAVYVLGAVLPTVTAAAQVGFDSAEQAFQDAFLASGIGQRGYEENREYAAALYQMPDGRWYATAVVAGGRTRSSIPYDQVPAQAIRIAGAHTHGQPRLPEDPSHVYGTDYSQTDRRNAIRAYQASRGRIDSQLLLTSQLRVLRMSIELGYDPGEASIALRSRTEPVDLRLAGHESVTVSVETLRLSRADPSNDAKNRSDCGFNGRDPAVCVDALAR